MCARRLTSAMPKPFLCCSMVVACFDVMKSLAGWDEVMWLVVRWCGASYRGMSCHVFWCGVHACVVSCCVMRCDVLWCALMWWAVICCALQWHGMLWALDADVCKVTLWGSKWFCDDVVIQRTKKHDKEIPSTTLYHKVLVQYYSVLCTLLQYYKGLTRLQSPTPVLLCTTKD